MIDEEIEIRKILDENDRRNAVMRSYFNPVSGEGSILERNRIEIKDFSLKVQYVPTSMTKIKLVSDIVEEGSIISYIENRFKDDDGNSPELDEEGKQILFDMILKQLVRIRIEHDFCFWAATLVFIKRKGGGEDIRFVLNRSQRRLISKFERKRLAGMPIRLILLKARQWGGSTATQLYFAWLQLCHKVGLNSLIVSQVKDTSVEIKDMFDRMLKHYPVEYLHKLSDIYDAREAKSVGVGRSGNIQRIPQRNCKIKIGTAEKPDSARGGDYNLVHCSEIGLWKVTEGKKPEDIVRSATSGINLEPYTAIVYESTANGVGNFFHGEYTAAKDGTSQFDYLFIAWFDIEKYAIKIDDVHDFAKHLFENRRNRNTNSDREECGEYLWWLWEKGATLEAIHWYILEREKYHDHSDMASEYPSDDIEAFSYSGTKVFDRMQVEALRKNCRKPMYIGDVYADGDEGEEALKNLRFVEDRQGLLWVWKLPEIDEEEKITDRYEVVVDIGGRSKGADFSVIAVFDRLLIGEGGKPELVAQWYGHIDMDILAWKAAQIAAFYDDAYLIIESNTLETHDKERDVDGDQSDFIINRIKSVYDNLYARKQSAADIKEKKPVRYGYHTNVHTKPVLISTLVKVIRESSYIERDSRCVDEYLSYEKKQNGAFGAISGKHDDLLMTRAIAMQVSIYEMGVPQIIPRHIKPRKVRYVSEATI